MIIGYDKQLSLATQKTREILHIIQKEYNHNSRTKKPMKEAASFMFLKM